MILLEFTVEGFNIVAHKEYSPAMNQQDLVVDFYDFQTAQSDRIRRNTGDLASSSDLNCRYNNIQII
jgi:hypothetical protein